MFLLLKKYVFVAWPLIWLISCSETENSGNVTYAGSFTIKGVALVATVHEIDTAEFTKITDVYANSIVVMPYAFCGSAQPKVKYNMQRQWWGETAFGVAQTTLLARQKNLAVMLKPHLWIGQGEYSGEFSFTDPKDWKIWEDSYLDYIVHFARIADSVGAELFCIGTELGRVVEQRPAFWNRLIDSVKNNYRGKITYAANWDDYYKVPFWKKLDYIGIDAYFPLMNKKTPSLKEVADAWKKYLPSLEETSLKYNRQILFTEYGYRNADGCTAEPWKENSNSVNNTAQMNAYKGFYSTFAGKAWFAGGYLWKWYGEDRSDRQNEVDYTPQGKPAMEVINDFYSISSAR